MPAIRCLNFKRLLSVQVAVRVLLLVQVKLNLSQTKLFRLIQQKLLEQLLLWRTGVRRLLLWRNRNAS